MSQKDFKRGIWSHGVILLLWAAFCSYQMDQEINSLVEEDSNRIHFWLLWTGDEGRRETPKEKNVSVQILTFFKFVLSMIPQQDSQRIYQEREK